MALRPSIVRGFALEVGLHQRRDTGPLKDGVACLVDGLPRNVEIADA